MKKLRLLPAIAFLCALALVLPHAKGARHILSLAVLQQRGGYGVVPVLKARVNELFIHTEIDGHRALLEVDTGDGVPGITLDNNAARMWGITGRPVKQKIYALKGTISDLRQGMAKSVTMGNVTVQDFPVFIGSFVTPASGEGEGVSGGLGGGADATVLGGEDRYSVHTDGVVGAEFLRRASAILDLQNMKLYLRPSGGGHKIDLTAALAAHGLSCAKLISREDGICLVDVEINGTATKMLVDTGAYYSEIDSRFADQIHLRQHRSNFYREDAAGVKTLVNKAFPDSLKVDGIKAYPPEATIDVGSIYTQSHGRIVGVLGLDFLGQSWAIMDFGNSKLYFAGAH